MPGSSVVRAEDPTVNQTDKVLALQAFHSSRRETHTTKKSALGGNKLHGGTKQKKYMGSAVGQGGC